MILDVGLLSGLETRVSVSSILSLAEKKRLTLKKHICIYNMNTHIYLVSLYLFLQMQYIVVEPYYVLYKKCYNGTFKVTNTDPVEERGVTALLVYKYPGKHLMSLI